MLQVKEVSKAYGSENILNTVSLIVNSGERVALVGPNGCGKSTLLRIVIGEEEADHGEVAINRNHRIGYLPQGLTFEEDLLLGDVLRSGIPGYQEAWIRLGEIEIQLGDANADTLETIMQDYDLALGQFEGLGGYSVEARIDEVRQQLGLDTIDLDTPISRLSGGQQTRLGLARILISRPDILLLDEPTNHLDIAAIEWLEGFLKGYRGAVLIVSHDRMFLDQIVTTVIDIDEVTHHAKTYPGNYSDFMQTRDRELRDHWLRWKEQEAERARIETAIRRISDQATGFENTSKNDFQRRKARVLMQKATAQKTRLEKYLEAEERLDKPKPRWELKVEFGDMPRGGQEVLELSEVGHQFGGQETLFTGFSDLVTHGERIVLVGPNGVGKTTLLKGIIGELALSAGTIRYGSNVHIGYMPQQQESLDPNLNPLSLLQGITSYSETDIRNFLHYFLFAGDDVFIPIGDLSYGQRSRLLLAKMIATGCNCLLLDEPMNHLDIPSREKFETALEAFPGTILVTSHDRAFMDRFATRLWAFTEQEVQSYLDRKEMLRYA